MTYYKYAEREASSQINWAQISKGLTDTIGQIDKDRQAKKAAIDEATRQDMLTLADAPKGENTTASEWTIKYANDMMNYRLTIDRLLKSGQMSLKDYQVASQNSKDSTNLLFTIAQEYQDEYKTIMDRKNTVASSVWEAEMAAHNESLANLAGTTPYINSTNGMVFLSNPKTGPDGVEQMGDNYVSLQALRNRIKFKIDRYDLSGNIKDQTDKLGKYSIDQLGKTNFRRTGVITDIEDPTLRKTYEDWENATVDQIMSNHYSLASVMGDYMVKNPKTGNQYRMTLDKKEFEADKTGDVILMENQNGSGIIMPQFTEDQRTDVKNFLKGQIKNYIDQTSEKDVFSEPGVDYAPQYIYEAGKGAKTAKEEGNMLAKLYSGDSAEVQAAVDHFNGLSDVSSVKRTPDGIDVTLVDGNTKTIRFKNPDGTLKTQADFVRSASKLLIGDAADVNEVLRGAIATKGKGFNDKSSASAITQRAASSEDINKTYSSHVRRVIPSILKPGEVTSTYYGQKVKGFKTDDGKSILSEEEVADKLNASLQDLGFEVSVPTKYGDYISIRNKDGVETEVSIADPTSALKAIEGFVVGNVPGKNAIERNSYLVELKSKGAISPTGASGEGTVKGGNVR